MPQLSTQPIVSVSRQASFQPTTRDHHITATRRADAGNWWHDRSSRYVTANLGSKIEQALNESFRESEGLSLKNRCGGERQLWEDTPPKIGAVSGLYPNYKNIAENGSLNQRLGRPMPMCPYYDANSTPSDVTTRRRAGHYNAGGAADMSNRVGIRGDSLSGAKSPGGAKYYAAKYRRGDALLPATMPAARPTRNSTLRGRPSAKEGYSANGHAPGPRPKFFSSGSMTMYSTRRFSSYHRHDQRHERGRVSHYSPLCPGAALCAPLFLCQSIFLFAPPVPYCFLPVLIRVVTRASVIRGRCASSGWRRRKTHQRLGRSCRRQISARRAHRGRAARSTARWPGTVILA